jgi:hypothetical protein
MIHLWENQDPNDPSWWWAEESHCINSPKSTQVFSKWHFVNSMQFFEVKLLEEACSKLVSRKSCPKLLQDRPEADIKDATGSRYPPLWKRALRSIAFSLFGPWNVLQYGRVQVADIIVDAVPQFFARSDDHWEQFYQRVFFSRTTQKAFERKAQAQWYQAFKGEGHCVGLLFQYLLNG